MFPILLGVRDAAAEVVQEEGPLVIFTDLRVLAEHAVAIGQIDVQEIHLGAQLALVQRRDAVALDGQTFAVPDVRGVYDLPFLFWETSP